MQQRNLFLYIVDGEWKRESEREIEREYMLMVLIHATQFSLQTEGFLLLIRTDNVLISHRVFRASAPMLQNILPRILTQKTQNCIMKHQLPSIHQANAKESNIFYLFFITITFFRLSALLGWDWQQIFYSFAKLFYSVCFLLVIFKYFQIAILFWALPNVRWWSDLNLNSQKNIFRFIWFFVLAL